jgi:uncharacterized DUF497 family protein
LRKAWAFCYTNRRSAIRRGKKINFEWDEAKNKINKLKHGIDFADAQYVFADPLHQEIYDKEHSTGEERWIIIGNIGMVVIVVVTFKDGDTIRIISARKAEHTERKVYYEQNNLQ